MEEQRRSKSHVPSSSLGWVAILACVLAVSGCGKKEEWIKDTTTKVHVIEIGNYERGVNDALMANAMLDLEQMIQGTNRSNGDMAKIVCKRLGVRWTIEYNTEATQ